MGKRKFIKQIPGLTKKGRLEQALAAYEKAEIDNGGKYPDASNSKGIVLEELGRYEEALAAYEKAEIDNGGKYSGVSFNKGICYFKFGRLDQARLSYIKALEDAEDHHYPMAHYFLAKLFLLIKGQEESEYHAFEALFQNSRHFGITELIFENFSKPNTKDIYQNRLNYLDLSFTKRVLDWQNINTEEYKAIFQKFYQHAIKKESLPLELFQDLLIIQSVQFTTSISYQERLRLAYITHFLKKQPHYTFYLIDEVMDKNFDLDGMDYYFYMASAYQIGEPINELEYFIKYERLPPDDPFLDDFNMMREAFARAIRNNKKYDPYLIQLDTFDFIPSVKTLQGVKAHPWIQNALQTLCISAADSFVDYEIPVQEIVLKGMSIQLIADMFNKLNKEEYSNNTEWRNVLLVLKEENIEYSHLVDNIRAAIQGEIPHWLILAELFQKFQVEQDEIKKHNLAVMEAAVLISHYVDYLKKPLNRHSYQKILGESLAHLIMEKLVELIIVPGLLIKLGIGIAIGLVENVNEYLCHGNRKTSEDELFKELIKEIRYN